jgi:endonuclease YncB( thermonuclease family)
VMVIFALTGLVAIPASDAGRFNYRGEVTRAVDGDTIVVRLESGRLELVRLIGVDSPERGECYAGRAAERARQLALDKPVTLLGDASHPTRDRYGRLLAYVYLPYGKDLGFQLTAGGHGVVYLFRGAFKRLVAYRTGESRARRAGRGLWAACRRRCNPSYPSVCAFFAVPRQGMPRTTPDLPLVERLAVAALR